MSAPLTDEERENVTAYALATLNGHPVGAQRKDVRAVDCIQHMVGDVDVRTAAQIALTWLEVHAEPWTATFEIAALRAALKVRS